VIDTTVTAEIKAVSLSYSNKGIYKIEAWTSYPHKVKCYIVYTNQLYTVGEKIIINTVEK
jgi:hypothetical protein